MDPQLMQLLYHTVQTYNILPVTSVCNVRCIFCSHRQNPPGIRAVSVPPLPFNIIKDLIGFLDKNRKIVIGESASLIMEGEPFTHPQIIETLELIRHTYPRAIIQLTSNGSFFDEDLAKRLKEMEPLEINLSINIADLQLRERLMNDKRAAIACKAPEVLSKYNIAFHGSIVAMPHVTGFDKLYETLKFLSDANAQTIRVFKPGFTKYTPQNLLPGKDLLDELDAKIKEWRENLCLCPITFEPSLLSGLEAEVVGVIRNSPAEKAGIIKGDIIEAIDGKKPFSRVEAFKMLQKNAQYNLGINGKHGRCQTRLTVTNEKSGLVFDYDIPFSLLQDIQSIINRMKGEKLVLFSSKLGHKLLQENFADIENLQVVPVKNLYFGGNIQCAGLLIINDFLAAFKLLFGDRGTPDVLILPSIAFDKDGRDITGRGLWELEELTGCQVVLI
ncbi:MAG: radical SAM protein [Bacillota bacterium]